jgi:hypothetical protein
MVLSKQSQLDLMAVVVKAGAMMLATSPAPTPFQGHNLLQSPIAALTRMKESTNTCKKNT